MVGPRRVGPVILPLVTRYVVVPDRSRVDITARPALPGLRLTIDEVSGEVELDGPVDGTGERAGRGALQLWIQARVDDADRAGSTPRWLVGDPVAVTGEIEQVRCDGERVELRYWLVADDRTVPLTGAGRIEDAGEPDPGRIGPDVPNRGLIRAIGVSIVDPRALGFALPPLVTYVLHARWRVTLAPGPPPPAAIR